MTLFCTILTIHYRCFIFYYFYYGYWHREIMKRERVNYVVGVINREAPIGYFLFQKEGYVTWPKLSLLCFWLQHQNLMHILKFVSQYLIFFCLIPCTLINKLLFEYSFCTILYIDTWISCEPHYGNIWIGKYFATGWLCQYIYKHA